MLSSSHCANPVAAPVLFDGAGFPLEQAGVLKTGVRQRKMRGRGRERRDMGRWNGQGRVRLRPGVVVGGGGDCVSVCVLVGVEGGVVCLSKNNEMCRGRGGGLGDEEGTRPENAKARSLQKAPALTAYLLPSAACRSAAL